ncbi:unnamed protein product [marine sediment metagenome]|uniref:Uncharacterized protein n=1 Tax=marine sediment metagenome TaxID=412755 RepID=X0ZPQ3_9ZZZZ
MENQEEIIEKIRGYLEIKLDLDNAECYILTSLLAKSYLEELEVGFDRSDIEDIDPEDIVDEEGEILGSSEEIKEE